MADKTPFKGETPCPCKRKGCPRFADCDACYKHHHLPGKKLPTTCERIRAKQTSDEPDNANGKGVVSDCKSEGSRMENSNNLEYRVGLNDISF